MKKILISLLVGLGLHISVQASPLTKPSAQEIVQQLLEQSQEFAKTHSHEYFQQFQGEQNPSITLLGCSDSRAHAVAFTKDPVNQIFSVRNIGNQIHNSFGSVDYGIYHLKTPILLILGHTQCGAVHTALTEYSQESFAIVREIDHLAAHLRQYSRPPEKNAFAHFWQESIQRNVDYQVQIALKRYANEIKTGQLTVIGAVYDFTNAYQQGEGHVIIVNLNGETDLETLRQSKLFTKVSPLLKQKSIQRQPYATPMLHPPQYTH